MSLRIMLGDCIQSMRSLADGSVHCCVTSPPYFGLRDYGTAKWEGGDPDCSHRPDDTAEPRGIASSTLGGGKSHTGHKQEGFKSHCPRCGAARVDGQIGLEPTPEDFVAKMVEVFREVRRVLRDDGTLWLNLGDSYNSVGGGYSETGSRGKSAVIGAGTQAAVIKGRNREGHQGLKPKDLMGMPWRVALALQADGWYLRQDIIWHKPNPMPESVRDRCTKAHEYIFLLSKSERYFFDSEAMKEPAISGEDWSGKTTSGWAPGPGPHTAIAHQQKGKRRKASDNFKRDDSKRSQAIPGQSVGTHRPDRDESKYDITRRNKRSVWTVAARPFKGAHFATFPPSLIEPCVLAGCPADGIVLDPFGGSGTTAGVALANGRGAILCELNPEYAAMIPDRIEAIVEAKTKPRRKPKKAASPEPANDNEPGQMSLWGAA